MGALALAVAIAGGGFELPEYRGSHYTAAGEKFLTCVALRESSGRWAADGPYGSGAFQMVQRTWDHYAARAGYPEWIGKRAAKAPAYVQTEVAFVMVNPFPKRKGLEGAHHWSPVHALTVGKRIKDCR
jgi:hypothetical protein